MNKPDITKTPEEIDDIQDRMGDMRELDFSDRKDERGGRIGDEMDERDYEGQFPEERVRQAGMTGGETLDHQPTMDDASPETLLDETGARSPTDYGDAWPNDKELSVVEDSDIGGGSGQDEAELGRSHPLDGEAWDGEADAPNEAETQREARYADLDADDEDLAGDTSLDLDEKRADH